MGDHRRWPVAVIAEQLRRPVPGGIGTYIRGLCHGLAALDPGAAVLVASWVRGPDPLAGLGIPLARLALPSLLLTRAWEHGVVGVPRHTSMVHACSLMVPWKGRTPRSVMVHDVAWRTVPEAFPSRGRAWHEAALARALDRSAVLVVPSHATAEALQDAGAAPERVVIIEEGSDHLPPPDAAGARSLLQRLGVAGPFLLTVSTVEPRKNLPRLLAAYSRARPLLPEPWPLVVVGPAGWGPALEPVEGVVLAGAVASDAVLAALYGAARVVAYVPLAEGWGLPAVEAMAAGAPVVASGVPSVGSGAATGALIVDPMSVEAIATALLAVADDSTERERVVASGTARAAGLSWTTAAKRHVELWDSLR